MASTPGGSEEREAEIVEELLSLPHVQPELDLPAAREIAALTMQAERVDAALANGRVENRRGQLRALLEHRRRLSRQLERWYDAFGLTPKSRFEFASRKERTRQRLEHTSPYREAPSRPKK
jgi:hypothetical protein